MKTLNQKFENLKNLLKQLGNVAVAFSGGVDSAYLLYEAVKNNVDKTHFFD